MPISTPLAVAHFTGKKCDNVVSDEVFLEHIFMEARVRDCSRNARLSFAHRHMPGETMLEKTTKCLRIKWRRLEKPVFPVL